MVGSILIRLGFVVGLVVCEDLLKKGLGVCYGGGPG